MIQSFDSYGLYEPPSFILCNPDMEELYSLGMIRERKYMPRYNGLGSISFIADAYVDGNEVEYYDYLEYRRLVYLENLGYFMITQIDKEGDGVNETKTIKGESLEVELVTKKITAFTGTFKFYDLLDTSDTLMGRIMEYLPGWNMGTIDSFELTTKYRTFDISDSTIYNFLMQDVEEAYQCIFDFDTITKTINVYTIDRATTTSDIYLSYDNVIKNININEKTDELVTALSVYGGDGLSINVVNPLGTNTIYDFSHFESTEWMSQDLLDALDAWNTKRELNQSAYADLAADLLNAYVELETLEAELSELEIELAVLETEKSALIAAGSSLSAINSEISSKNSAISLKQAEVDDAQSDVDDIIASLNAISDDLAFDNTENFSQEQLVELSPFVIGSTYNNENIIQTDSMSASAIQIQGQYLFDQAEDVLAKVSQPRYEFRLESANFIFTQDFSPFISQLALGTTITIEINENEITSAPVLLGIDLDYDDPESFTLIFGNRLRLDDSAYALADLLNESQKSSIETRFNSERWSNWNDYKNDVTTFISSALDVATNNLVSGSGQNILINQSGIRIRQSIGTNEFSPNQMWMNNGVLAFSSDSFETSRLALGQVTVNGQIFYGLVADAVVGHLIAGNELIISNSHPTTGVTTFEVTGSMVRIDNGYLTLTNTTNIISLAPNDGIKIDKILPSGVVENQMYIDTNGNLIFKGNISGASGTFTGAINAPSGFIDGWEIRDNGLWDTNGNYIRSDGKVQLGALWIDGSQAIFSGNFYADNLLNQIQAYQIGSVNAGTVNSGVLAGIRVYGCEIGWGGTYYDPSVVMKDSATHNAQIVADESFLIQAGTSLGAAISMRGDTISDSRILIYSNNKVQIGGMTSGAGTIIDLKGNIQINGLTAVSGAFPIGSGILSFTNGILTSSTVSGGGSLGSSWILSDPVSGTVSGIQISHPGVATVFGRVCRIGSGGSFELASNTTVDSSNALAMYVSAGSWLLYGVAKSSTWSWSAGELIYLGTGGQMTQTVPSGSLEVAQVVGVALSSTKMLFNPNLVQVEML